MAQPTPEASARITPPRSSSLKGRGDGSHEDTKTRSGVMRALASGVGTVPSLTVPRISSAVGRNGPAFQNRHRAQGETGKCTQAGGEKNGQADPQQQDEQAGG